MSVFLLTIMVLVGGVGLYLLMPGARLASWKAGLVLSAVAAAALLAEIGRHVPQAGTRTWFGIFALLGLIGATRVITNKQPVYSALFFILVALCVTGMLVLLDAQFLAAGLLAIYAGAILVTYVFVIMLAQTSGTASYDHTAREPLWGVVAGFLLFGAIAGALLHVQEGGAIATVALTDAGRGTVRNIGVQLMTTYVVAIQLAGVLLLSAMVGAIAIARRKAATSEFAEVD